MGQVSSRSRDPSPGSRDTTKYRRLHICRCYDRFSNPKTVQKKPLGRIGWNFAWITFLGIQITSSKRFLIFGPRAELWGPLGVRPGGPWRVKKFFPIFQFIFYLVWWIDILIVWRSQNNEDFDLIWVNFSTCKYTCWFSSGADRPRSVHFDPCSKWIIQF